MADYKTIHGTSIQNFSADPDNPIEGQIWYDETAATIQYQIPNKNAAGIWRTGNTSPYTALGMGGAGSQTAALIFGGEGPPGTEVNTAVSYNGTTFSGVNSMNEQRQISQNFGTSTSAIAASGELNRGPPGVLGYTESWDGSAWTETGNLSTAREGVGAAGTTNSGALAAGGTPASPQSGLTATEEYTGIGVDIGAWSSGGNLNTARSYLAGMGTQTAAFGIGGAVPPTTNIVEQYDGSSWMDYPDPNHANTTGNYNDPQYKGPRNTFTA